MHRMHQITYYEASSRTSNIFQPIVTIVICYSNTESTMIVPMIISAQETKRGRKWCFELKLPLGLCFFWSEVHPSKGRLGLFGNTDGPVRRGGWPPRRGSDRSVLTSSAVRRSTTAGPGRRLGGSSNLAAPALKRDRHLDKNGIKLGNLSGPEVLNTSTTMSTRDVSKW